MTPQGMPPLTLRDRFAIVALRSIMALPQPAGTKISTLAKTAYEVADAMISARESSQGGAK